MDLAHAIGLVLFAGITAQALRRTRSESLRARQALKSALETGRDQPASLHPQIDAGACIGCGACVRACPEKGVLGLIDGQAQLVDPASCVGHGACARACPAHAIQLVLGTEKRGVDIPELRPDYQTNVPGLYVAGELGGMGLIRNAVRQGALAVEGLEPPARELPPGALDLAVVGAGPAGIAAALQAKQRGLRFVVLEQESDLGGSILHYPRRKVVLSTAVALPGRGRIKASRMSKEDLLAVLREVVEGAGLPIRFGCRLERVERRQDGLFELCTSQGPVSARQVLLAIGRRGTPQKLGVPGEELPKVAYRLKDPEEYRGARCLVIGGGDSALEAAVALAGEPDTQVSRWTSRPSTTPRPAGRFGAGTQRPPAARATARAAASLALRPSAPRATKTRTRASFRDRRCDSCHTTQGWKSAAGKLDHDKTRFPLTGKHVLTPCESCHKQGLFRFDSLECKTCHEDVYKGRFADRGCESCHNTAAFKPVRYDHAASAFPLKGKHAQTPCASCHKAGKFRPVPHERCASCHKDVHEGQLAGKDCASCHAPAGWKPARFDHDKDSRFPLLGQHRQVPCQDCHKSGRYKPLAPDCASCHTDVHKDPRKAVCKDCHTPGGWKLERYPHDLPTFRLEGQHQTLACTECHKSGVQPLAPDCASCHRDVHAGQLGTQCESCHQPLSWTLVQFQHVDLGDRLFGVHAALACRDCHSQNRFKGQSTECLACHQAQYQQASSPDHKRLGFVVCRDCHTQTSWRSASFGHDRFPLRGGHAGLDCQDCHRSGQYAGTSSACQSCHSTDYDATRNPNHRTAGFPLTCESCHSVNAWRPPAALDHGRFFPLEGAHRAAACESCHRNGQYAGTPRQCVGCHQAEYNATRNPNHAQSGFPTSCEQCHSVNAWTPASFNHDQFFALTGAHRAAACESCHRNGQYAGTPRQCVGCHQAEYNATRNPNHAQSGFPTSCEQCHSTNAWTPASFDHDRFFPLPHHGVSVCSDCHRGGNVQQFSCIDCHEHNRADTDKDHREVGGYQYSSQACYNCHRRGSADN